MIQEPKQTTVYQPKSEYSMLIRVIWMLCVGWWLAGIFYMVGVILTLMIITAPLGMVVIQKIGWAFSLYTVEDVAAVIVTSSGDTIIIPKQGTPFMLRFVYFLLFGWWFGGIALFISMLCGVTIIGLPISFMITNRLGNIMTLAS